MNRRGFLGLIASAPAAVALKSHAAIPSAPEPAALSGPFLIFTERDILRGSFYLSESIHNGTTCKFDTNACAVPPDIGQHVTVHLSEYGLMFTGEVVGTSAEWGHTSQPRVTIKAHARGPVTKNDSWSDIYDEWKR